MAKKVLVVYATGGMGHVTAAKAVVQAFSEKYPEVKVKNVDVLDYSDPIYKKVFVGGYNWVSSNKPGVWGKLYRIFNKPASQKLPTLISRIAVEKKFINFVKSYNPDFIVSTHPLRMPNSRPTYSFDVHRAGVLFTGVDGYQRSSGSMVHGYSLAQVRG